jgi:hypothetical protein
VIKAFTQFYTAPQGVALSFGQGADRAVINANNQAMAGNPGIIDVGVSVDQVVSTSPTAAAVGFDIFKGSRVLSGDISGAV